MHVTLDGPPLAHERVQCEESGLFSVTLPADNLFGLPAGFLLDPCVDAGYYVHLDPLEPGHHTTFPRRTARRGHGRCHLPATADRKQPAHHHTSATHPRRAQTRPVPLGWVWFPICALDSPIRARPRGGRCAAWRRWGRVAPNLHRVAGTRRRTRQRSIVPGFRPALANRPGPDQD
jgi:hypothetical protein